MKLLTSLIFTLLLASTTVTLPRPTNDWLIYAFADDGTPKQVMINQHTPEQAMRVFRKNYGDIMVTCMARASYNVCAERTLPW